MKKMIGWMALGVGAALLVCGCVCESGCAMMKHCRTQRMMKQARRAFSDMVDDVRHMF